MTDRELLEMAAKAVGVEYIGYVNGNQCEGLRVGKGYIWNPLKDDGDAFGIMVELGLRVQYCDTEPHDGRLNRLCTVTWIPKG